MKTMTKGIISILLFIIVTVTSWGQVLVTITNQEINEDVEFTLVYETDSSLYKSEELQKTKNFIVDTSKFTKLTISHVGYFDTTVLSKNLKAFNLIKLLPNYKLLETVVIKKLEEFSNSDLKTKKGMRLFFSLSSNFVWHFTIKLPEGTSKLKSFKLCFKNLMPNDTLEFKLYNNKVDALNSEPFFSNRITVLDSKANLVDVLNGLNKNLDVENSFLISVSVHASNKDLISTAMLLSKFKREETQIYYQGRKNELYKYPMKTYFENFSGYPHLSTEITFLK